MSSRFIQALAMAAELHAPQKRKCTEIPYIGHLLSVAGIAIQFGADEDEAIAALLHDAVEDQGGPPTRERIRQAFGEHVAVIIDGCTDTDASPKPPWRERKEAYLEHLKDASPSVVLVSASDKLDNARAILSDLRTVGEAVWKRFHGGKEGTLWYYRTLVEILRVHPNARPPLVRELARVVEEIERLANGSA